MALIDPKSIVSVTPVREGGTKSVIEYVPLVLGILCFIGAGRAYDDQQISTKYMLCPWWVWPIIGLVLVAVGFKVLMMPTPNARYYYKLNTSFSSEASSSAEKAEKYLRELSASAGHPIPLTQSTGWCFIWW